MAKTAHCWYCQGVCNVYILHCTTVCNLARRSGIFLSTALNEALKKQFFLEIIPKSADPPLSIFRNENLNFAHIQEQKCEFHGQKQWPPKFHIQFRNPRPPPLTQEVFLKNVNFFTPSLNSHLFQNLIDGTHLVLHRSYVGSKTFIYTIWSIQSVQKLKELISQPFLNENFI